ncbi:hypothetical protein JOC94_004116 [Bacillus thermophilus]|uniref:Uncharacterized protein n=1 Tax=Siminovitchia thermophila TaxID=1245522 RepID=A0ABS2RBR4_9BACI|nr:hypothetical protein [Siminovitchia thermophila]
MKWTTVMIMKLEFAAKMIGRAEQKGHWFMMP